jgi:hypothetical protein
MTVADLIELLRLQDPNATPVLWSYAAGGHVQLYKLSSGEVFPIEFGTYADMGRLWLEPWNLDDKRLAGPFPGVMLGARP